MTDPRSPLTLLQALLQADPTLQAALRQSSDTDHFKQLITISAQRHAIHLDMDALMTQLETRLDQFKAQGTSSATDLADQQLEAVAGGGDVFDWIYQLMRHVRDAPYRLQQERNRRGQ